MSKRKPTAPWDRPGARPGDRPKPKDEPASYELEVEVDLGRPARRPRESAVDTQSGPAPARRGPPPGPAPAPQPSGFSMAGEETPSYSAEDSISFWSLQAADGPAPGPTDDEPLSGTDEVFDPATGWDFAAVSDSDLQGRSDRPDPSPPPSPSTPPSPPAASSVADLPDWGEPAFDGAGPSYSDLPTPPSATGDGPLPDLDGAPPWPPGNPTAAPAVPEELSDPAPDATPGPGPNVVFDNDGFFSVADVAAPVPASSPPPEPLEESAEFEFEVDDDPPEELSEDDIYSQSAIPAVPPDLAALPVEEAVETARALFANDDPALGMAVLQAARMRAPEDTRVETWLEFGERRLIARFAPGATGERVPVLLHPGEKLLRVTAGDQATLIAAVDGARTIAQLRLQLPQLPVVGFWKDVGKLLERGWLGWADERSPG